MFLTTEELAERYQLPVQTIRQWRWKDFGPKGVKMGRHVRYPIAEVERWERELAAS